MVWATPVPQRFTASARGKGNSSPPAAVRADMGKQTERLLRAYSPTRNDAARTVCRGEKAAMASAVSWWRNGQRAAAPAASTSSGAPYRQT